MKFAHAPVYVLLFAFSVRAEAPLAQLPILPPPYAGTTALLVADVSNGTISLVEDLNQDGDAMDVSEVEVFFDSSSPNTNLHLTTPNFLAVDNNQTVYVTDYSQDFIVRLQDLNGDGNANGANESTLYFDDQSIGTDIHSLSSIAIDADGYLFVTDTGTSVHSAKSIWRIRDEDGDGYCQQSMGEVTLIYSSQGGAGAVMGRPSSIIIEASGTLLVSDRDNGSIRRLCDTFGSEDSDANDSGEQILVFESLASTGLDLTSIECLARDSSNDVLFVADRGSRSVYRVQDADLSLNFDNPAEISSYWDDSQADGISPGTPRTITLASNGELYVCDSGSVPYNVPTRIIRLLDINGDLAANAAGEACIFLDNSNQSAVIFGELRAVALYQQSSFVEPQFLRGDTNGNGAVQLDDVITLLTFLFSMGPEPLCKDAADTNDNSAIGIDDPISLLAYLFDASVTSLPAPGTIQCATDPTIDSLGCQQNLNCP